MTENKQLNFNDDEAFPTLGGGEQGSTFDEQIQSANLQVPRKFQHLTELEHNESFTIMKESDNNDLNFDKPHLVLDTNAFLKGIDLSMLNEKYLLVTSPAVINEVRDLKSRESLLKYSDLIEQIPFSENSLRFVKQFALSTGDFHSLSEVDMQLIAIAYTLCEKRKKIAHLRKSPLEPLNFIDGKIINHGQIFDEDDEEENPQIQKQQADEGWNSIPISKQNQNTNSKSQKQNKQNYSNILKEAQQELQQESQTENINEHQQKQADVIPEQNQIQTNNIPQINSDEQPDQLIDQKDQNDIDIQEIQDEEEDDGEGWINQDNLQSFLQEHNKEIEDKNQQIGVYIMSADYAIQNISLQIGLPLLSYDGMTINKAKRFILECYACYNLCKDNSKIFCPKCGNQALLKVSCSVNADGSLILYRKKGFKVNTKGFIYQLPSYQGGRDANNVVLKEDELFIGQKKYLMGGKNKKDKQQNLLTATENIHFEDIVHKQRKLPKVEFAYSKQNPASRTYKKKK